jgi:DinB superfamily
MSEPMRIRPDRSEAAPYYFTYIDKVPEGDICGTLEAQAGEALAFFQGIDDARAGDRYAPDKWSIAEVVNHLNDCERVFAFRAFWFARGFSSPLPSFDQNDALRQAGVAGRPWAGHIDEFRAVRSATLPFFAELPPEAWERRGIASDNPFSVRALAYIIAGHVEHHIALLKERYL